MLPAVAPDDTTPDKLGGGDVVFYTFSIPRPSQGSRPSQGRMHAASQ